MAQPTTMEKSSPPRTSCLLLIGLSYACVLGFGLYGRHFEPLTGDLTRIGWFAENEFGWTLPQRRFVPPLAPAASLDGRYELIAIGDSFPAEGTHPGTAWPQAVAGCPGPAVALSTYCGAPPAARLAV